MLVSLAEPACQSLQGAAKDLYRRGFGDTSSEEVLASSERQALKYRVVYRPEVPAQYSTLKSGELLKLSASG